MTNAFNNSFFIIERPALSRGVLVISDTLTALECFVPITNKLSSLVQMVPLITISAAASLIHFNPFPFGDCFVKDSIGILTTFPSFDPTIIYFSSFFLQYVLKFEST